MTSFHDVLAETLETLKTGDVQGAFEQLRPLLEFPAGELQSREHWQDALRVFAILTSVLGNDKLGTGIRLLAHEPDEPRLLVALGNLLIEEGLPGVAATFLARANELHPGDEGTLLKLAIALELLGRFGTSCEFLRASDVLPHSATCRYFLAVHTLMAGNLEEARGLVPGLVGAPDPHEIIGRGLAMLSGMLRRADALRGVTPLDERDLRGWHLVLTGGLLLHRSSEGSETMNGRYCFVQDDGRVCLEGIRRVEAVLRVWGVRPPRVFVLPDRDSEILGRATAQLLDAPAEPWPEEGAAAPGLIVVYDIANVDPECCKTFTEHAPGQVLWCHAASWTEEPPFAADLTTYLYQSNASPWGPRMQLTGDGMTWSEPVEGGVAGLAEQLVSATLAPDALDDIETVQALAAAAARVPPPDGPGAFRTAGRRRRQWCGSPVSSARFG